ncbi:MAG: hypothetical protein L0J01_04460 [Tetragenococcus halophilus]|nr:hypothetical protein [Tetragenococcus halophilus]MDN6184907.1 hypothetical protein [Lactococcus lactis]MDN6640964.1 hypothetical protein [Tetragenococcus sp.]MDN6751053.1 hypothetical protein [Staphylococcus equorum]MDN6187091.1 hypothetical protein [Tetragenococcus halophilus]
MESITRFTEIFPLKTILIVVFFLIFIIGGMLVVSGIKMSSENKKSKVVSIFLGIILMLFALFSGFYVFIFGYNS